MSVKNAIVAARLHLPRTTLTASRKTAAGRYRLLVPPRNFIIFFYRHSKVPTTHSTSLERLALKPLCLSIAHHEDHLERGMRNTSLVHFFLRNTERTKKKEFLLIDLIA